MGDCLLNVLQCFLFAVLAVRGIEGKSQCESVCVCVCMHVMGGIGSVSSGTQAVPLYRKLITTRLCCFSNDFYHKPNLFPPQIVYFLPVQRFFFFLRPVFVVYIMFV